MSRTKASTIKRQQAQAVVAPKTGRSSSEGWTTAAWHGVEVEVPDGWNLAAYGGDPKTGNFRLDNADASANAAVGLEVRWAHSQKPQKDADLERRVDQYFTGLIKDARKRKVAPDTRSSIVDDPDHPERPATRSFLWRTDRKGIGRIWYCGKCRRLMIAQVVTGLKGDHAGTANRVLDSLQCHSADPGWQPWSLYDLHTAVPPVYTLQRKPQLMNIYVQLAFSNGNSADEITVEQWGVANVQLRDAYLEEWFRDKSRPLIPILQYEADEAQAHGHLALRITGRRTGLRYWLGVAWPQIVRLRLPSTYFEAILWECPETNKVHLVQTFTRRRQADLVSEIVERTKCHS